MDGTQLPIATSISLNSTASVGETLGQSRGPLSNHRFSWIFRIYPWQIWSFSQYLSTFPDIYGHGQVRIEVHHHHGGELCAILFFIMMYIHNHTYIYTYIRTLSYISCSMCGSIFLPCNTSYRSHQSPPGQGFPGGYCARGDEAELTSWRKKTDCFAKKTGANLTQMGTFKHHLCVVFF